MLSKKYASCRQPTSSAWVGGMFGEACFREAVRLGRSVGWVVVYLVSPSAERLEKSPTMGGGE